jgi:electron transfer flavoprotein alpha/beta subunit
MEKFWMCYKVGDRVPHRQHETKEIAVEEASRIAQKHDCSVAVLEVVGYAKPREMPVDYTEV